MLIPLLANALVATGPTGAITGTVTDATGADVALLPPGHYQLSSVYDLPFGRKWLKGPGLGERLLAHWQAAGILTAQTGSPFTVNLAASESGSAIAAFGNPYRPDLTSNPYTPGPVMANPNPACHETIAEGGLAAGVVDQPGSWFNTCPAVSRRVLQSVEPSELRYSKSRLRGPDLWGGAVGRTLTATSRPARFSWG